MNDIGRPGNIANPIGVTLERLIEHPLSVRIFTPDLYHVVTTARHDPLGTESRRRLLTILVDGECRSPANRRATCRMCLLDFPRLPIAIAAQRNDAYRAVRAAASEYQAEFTWRPCNRVYFKRLTVIRIHNQISVLIDIPDDSCPQYS